MNPHWLSKKFGAEIPKRSLLVLSVLFLSPQEAAAIPSPELVIGSVSSLSQILAVVVATLTGSGAFIAKRLGLGPSKTSQNLWSKIALVFGLASVALLAANIWQFQRSQADLQAHLQATLLRPAQFDGTEIKDTNLIESSFASQENNRLGISTFEAEQLHTSDPEVVFIDVRETGEHQMGSIEGALHVRYPDFFKSNLQLQDKEVVLFCHNGNRSSETCAKLAELGIDCRFISGGIEKWLVEGRSLSDKSIETLSDLRSLPDFSNKDKLLSTTEFTKLFYSGDLQIVDTRYPGDFDVGHLPGAINIPTRALPTNDLTERISALSNRPVIAACYDRRSCFMGQVLGLELSNAGLDFRGRYTTPWEFFIPAPQKPHVTAWLAEQNATFWDQSVKALADILVFSSNHIGLLFSLLLLAAVSRLLVLPITLKSERDQLVSSSNRVELAKVKEDLQNDSLRKSRAIRQFYSENGMTPVRNMMGLLFLPLMMLGLSAAEQAGERLSNTILGLNSALPDPSYVSPTLFSALAVTYLTWVAAKNVKQAIFWITLATPAIFVLVMSLSVSGGIYLCLSVSLLLVQRLFVSGSAKLAWNWIKSTASRKNRELPLPGIHLLSEVTALSDAGNKSLRLAQMSAAGLPVPTGVVLTSLALDRLHREREDQKVLIAEQIWKSVGKKPCAVRSSARAEDGEDSSFAGIFETVLNVSQDNLLGAIETVNASFTALRSEEYSEAKGRSHEGNILVQQMIDAEYAGVLFTQDPSAPGLQMVEMVKGSGEGLVSGTLSPEFFRFGRISGRRFSEYTPVIEIAPLLTLGQKIEAMFGCPQDIEWAYHKGEFHILQSRDITAISDSNAASTVFFEEWNRVLEAFRNASHETLILEQDEMAEVLPTPTPISFDLMSRLWQPGGSLDFACRNLGLEYRLPEGRPGHLFPVFGRMYVDVELKQKTALNLSHSKMKRLRKSAVSIYENYQTEVSPRIKNSALMWQALDYQRLQTSKQIECVKDLMSEFVNSAYVDAEMINILAGFLLAEAEEFSRDDAKSRDKLMNAKLPHAPTQLIADCANIKGADGEHAVQKAMGHRSTVDYELSSPRYYEEPSRLLNALHIQEPGSMHTLTLDGQDPVSLAICFQDLKERAKHESLMIVAEIRRALLAVSDSTGLGDLVFYLTFDELDQIVGTDSADLTAELKRRQEHRKILLDAPLLPQSMTLCDLERQSSPSRTNETGTDNLGGTCVSGSGQVTGRVFRPDIGKAENFQDFQDGDIIVCRMIDPDWLPYVLRSGGILSEVGGWLSHMAIVAREKGIMMHVKCTGLSTLKAGQMITLSDDGSLEVSPAVQ